MRAASRTSVRSTSVFRRLAACSIPHLVALDLDGTTINHAGELSPAVRDAVHAVLAAGHHVIIATGRSIVATTTIIAELGIETGYAVCSNGAVTSSWIRWRTTVSGSSRPSPSTPHRR